MGIMIVFGIIMMVSLKVFNLFKSGSSFYHYLIMEIVFIILIVFQIKNGIKYIAYVKVILVLFMTIS